MLEVNNRELPSIRFSEFLTYNNQEISYWDTSYEEKEGIHRDSIYPNNREDQEGRGEKIARL